MSTTTVVAPYTMRTIQDCKHHPGKICMEFKLPVRPEGDQLALTIVPVRRVPEPSQIGVIDDLMKNCDPYRVPSGHDVLDSHTVHFYHPSGTHIDVSNEAKSKLKEKLEKRLNEIIAERNSAHRRNPQTGLVHKR